MTLPEIPPRPVFLLVGFVGLSSILGVSRGNPFRLDLVVTVWSLSLLADAVFIVGSVSAAIVAFAIARAGSAGLGAAASLALNWLVYGLSFVLLPGWRHAVDGGGLSEALLLVGAWGALGLAFATVAPAALGTYERRHAERVAPQAQAQASSDASQASDAAR